VRLAFLIHVEDLELRRRLRLVLTKLELLSEGRAAPMERSHTGKPESQAPAEVEPDRPSERPPPKDRSLYAWYIWHLERIHERDASQRRYRMLTLLAERDLERHVKRAPESRTAGHLHRASTAEADTIKRVIAWYEGVDSLEVAVIEECAQAWVEKVRRQQGRKAGDGTPEDNWRGWSEERKYEEIARLDACGFKVPAIAHRLRITPKTVRKYLSQVRRAA
jgi:hypothetical protein